MGFSGVNVKPRIIVVTDGQLTEHNLLEGPDKPGNLKKMERVSAFCFFATVIFVNIYVFVSYRLQLMEYKLLTLHTESTLYCLYQQLITT